MCVLLSNITAMFSEPVADVYRRLGGFVFVVCRSGCFFFSGLKAFFVFLMLQPKHGLAIVPLPVPVVCFPFVFYRDTALFVAEKEERMLELCCGNL